MGTGVCGSEVVGALVSVPRVWRVWRMRLLPSLGGPLMDSTGGKGSKEGLDRAKGGLRGTLRFWQRLQSQPFRSLGWWEEDTAFLRQDAQADVGVRHRSQVQTPLFQFQSFNM